MINRDNRIVTVFGGAGFIGRYVCEYLLQQDVRVRVASRNPRLAHVIQPLASPGQWGAVRADVTNEASIRAAVAGANAVINLCGVFGARSGAVNAHGAGAVAKAAREAGAGALVHISAIGSDASSDAPYARTKAEGEAAVRAAFPGATIVRPSIVFGPEDDLTNRLGALSRLPVLPVVASERRFKPVYVKDVARAIAMAALDPAKHGGHDYDIGGPQVMTMEDIYAVSTRAAGREPDLVAMPNFASSILSWFGFLPGAPLTREQWKLLQSDNLPAEKSMGLEAFGIEPTAFAAVAPEWLGRFRQGGRFAADAVDQAA
ncbi:complex I NDUFA9 subunit family protein [Sphingomonas sinipercae]|uniref:Complex I NDUFA9 subunit family protein n=1 Tax=Sphingomonas sinipercae TaxID=2714944 RepID=A0A6G7ZQH0_9SPHN|nr:complex I NDUFA9 subunit family protein [Sphingomonas sinipercae]QIL03150.1 complex I NDUFA9 subunit family protein [Sphingomonas sinipercae]